MKRVTLKVTLFFLLFEKWRIIRESHPRSTQSTASGREIRWISFDFRILHPFSSCNLENIKTKDFIIRYCNNKTPVHIGREFCVLVLNIGIVLGLAILMPNGMFGVKLTVQISLLRFLQTYCLQ